MANIFEITPDIKEIARQAVDDLIDQLGKDCRLIYPPKWEPCSCNSATNPGNKPSIHARHGGPVPGSSFGLCPLCNGTNKRQSEQSETLKLLCTWDTKEFVEPFKGIAVKAPDSYVQIKGYMKDVPKILQAIEIILQIDNEGYLRYKFKRAANPIDGSNIVQGRYFYCLLRQVG